MCGYQYLGILSYSPHNLRGGQTLLVPPYLFFKDFFERQSDKEGSGEKDKEGSALH